MKLVKLNGIRVNLPNSKGGYTFNKYNITGSSDFLFGLLLGVKNSGKTVCVLNYLIHEPHLLQGQNKVYFFSPTFEFGRFTLILFNLTNFIYKYIYIIYIYILY